MLVLDRGQVGAGTTSQSSGILRTHYSVRENVALAPSSWQVFKHFADYLGDDEASAGQTLPGPDNEQGDVSMDQVVDVGTQVAERFPCFAEAGLASSWTGVYDVTPDWNPVLGRLPGLAGLIVGYGFSGHGFKLSPAVGRVLAQEALGLPTEVPLAPYALERFCTRALLTGRYGMGAVT